MFTGAVNNPLASAQPGTSDGAPARPGPASAQASARARWGRRSGDTPAATAYWRGWPEIRADLRSAVALVLGLAVAGLPAGLLWWSLAPRADFRITGDGPQAIGSPSSELLIADDVVFVLVLAGFGLLAGAAAWFLRRRRGVATVVALAVGTSATGAVAWQLGELLGAGPTESRLADVGSVVTTSLTLGALPALAVAPFLALVAYIVATLHAAADDLGRVEPQAAGSATASPDPQDDASDADRLVLDSARRSGPAG
jgi:LPXTG-motif cell wall-anchored protein